MDLLRRIAIDRQAAIIVVTHDESIFNRFDRIFRLRDGRLVSIDRNKPVETKAAVLAANLAP
jgi:putative ABC transport system ATP-binding protein